MIKAVMFDYGGVLSPGGKTLSGIYTKLLGVTKKELDFDDLNIQFRHGDISSEDFFIELSRRYGKPVTAQQFNKLTDIFVKNEKVYQLAGQLRRHGLQTGILSNVYNLSADILQQDGYYAGFDPIVLSCREGMSKPDPLFYALAVEKLAVKPSEVLFIDDQAKLLPAAQALGIKTILAVSEHQIVANIKTILKKENELEL